MDEKSIETQQVTDEQLDDVVGGMRDSACYETRTREAVAADEEGEDQKAIPFIVCPMCGRPFYACTCLR